MRFLSVPRERLLLVAGGVWIVAGSMVMAVGLPLELRLAPHDLLLVPLAAAIFVAFYALVFSRLVRRHTIRIRGHAETHLPVYRFFNASSWAVMVVMMGGGMLLRASRLVPDWAIAFFYSGLGVALFLCGLRFVATFAGRDAVAAGVEETPPDR